MKGLLVRNVGVVARTSLVVKKHLPFRIELNMFFFDRFNSCRLCFLTLEGKGLLKIWLFDG